MDPTEDAAFDVDGDDRGQKAAPADAHSVDATWVPHVERVYLDEVDDGTAQVTDVITLERYTLKANLAYGIEYDEDGKGAVVGAREGSEPVVKLLSDLLKKDVYKDANNDVFITAPGQPNAQPLQVIMSRFREGAVAIFVLASPTRGPGCPSSSSSVIAMQAVVCIGPHPSSTGCWA